MISRYIHSLFLLCVFGASWCEACHHQIEELDRSGVKYLYIEVTNSMGDLGPIPILINDKGQKHHGVLRGDALLSFVRGA